MNLTARLSLMHFAGAAVLLATAAGGYHLALRPAAEARTLASALRQRLEQQQEELEALPSDVPAVSAEATAPDEPVAEPVGTGPMTPTLFLSSFESLARQLGLRVESSRELERPSAGADAAAGGLVFEITGTGTFPQLVELCDALPGPLPGMEIRSLRINRGADDLVRWTMVCRNHDGRAG